MPKPYRVLIVDASYLIRSNWEGTKNEYGTVKDSWMPNIINKLYRLRERTCPASIILCWDTPTSSAKRKAIFQGYKGNRPKPDPRYKPEVEAFKTVLPFFGLLQAQSTMGEADDIIATMAWRWNNCCIYTIDKDMLQLTNHADMIWAKRGGKDEPLINSINCKEVTSLSADEWTAFLSISGDTADGIKGVRGLGEKKAKAIINLLPMAEGTLIELFDLAAQGNGVAQKILLRKMKDNKDLQKLCNYRKELKLAESLVQLRKVVYELIPSDLDEDMAMAACASWNRPELFNNWFGKDTL